MKKQIVTLCLTAALAMGGVYRDAGQGVYPFLKMNVGARAAALGGTGAINGGTLSIFSNPALLAGLGRSVSAGGSRWFGSTAQSYLAGTSRIGNRFTGALGLVAVTTGGIEYRETPSSDPVDTFSAHDFSMNAAVAAEMGNFDAGVGFKLIHEKIWLETSNGWAVDAGVSWRPAPGLLLTGAYLHSGPAVSMAGKEYRFPRTWVAAAGWSFSTPAGGVEVSGQVMRPLDNNARAGTGLEFRPVNWAALRGGWKFNDDSSDLTAGAGLSASGWMLDYAFVPGAYSLGTSHRFTLSRTL